MGQQTTLVRERLQHDGFICLVPFVDLSPFHLFNCTCFLLIDDGWCISLFDVSKCCIQLVSCTSLFFISENHGAQLVLWTIFAPTTTTYLLPTVYNFVSKIKIFLINHFSMTMASYSFDIVVDSFPMESNSLWLYKPISYMIFFCWKIF